MKKCTKCGKEKDLEMFHKDKHNPDGFTYACKECRNNSYNEYYKNNPEKQQLKNNSQKINRKLYYESKNGIESSRRSHLKRNCGKIYLAVSHITIQNLGNDAITNYFDMVYTTNSKFSRYWDNTDRSFSVKNNLEIITLF